MSTIGPRTRIAARRIAGLALALLGLLLQACATESRVQVSSNPAGARILVDGLDTGRTTPSSVTLSTERESYQITIEKAGYNPVGQAVRLGTDVDVIDADEAVCTVCVSPCCCFLPLLRFLDPVDVRTRFRPSDLSVDLEVAGQGARLEITPSGAEVYLDGKLAALLDGNYLVTSVGDHQIEVRAEGCKPWTRTLHVDERIYQRIALELEIEGQGLLVSGTPGGAKIYLDDQFQGALDDAPRRVRTTPGPHLLRVEAEGFKPWQDVVQVTADRYEAISIELALDGQGVRLRKPEGLPSRTPELQLFVDGQLQGSAFDVPVRMSAGEHDLEIRCAGRETRRLRINVAPGQFLDLQPGPKQDTRAARPQKQPAGFCIYAPSDLGPVAPQDVQIRVGGVLVSQRLGELVEMTNVEPIEVEVVVRGFKPWKDRIVLSADGVTEVYPRLEKE